MITNHGEHRMRKRLGLPKRTVDKEFTKALESGKYQKDFTGRFRKYLDRKSIENKSRPIVYKHNIYWVNTNNILITVFPVPREYKKYL